MMSTTKIFAISACLVMIHLTDGRFIRNRKHELSLSTKKEQVLQASQAAQALKKELSTHNEIPGKKDQTLQATQTTQAPKKETSSSKEIPRKKPFGRNKAAAATDDEKLSTTAMLTKVLRPSTRSNITNCVDHPSWYDADGSDCTWYEKGSNRCSTFGDSYKNFGRGANEACCTCGGCVHQDGTKSVADTPCGWYDIDGPKYDCLWYGLVASRCEKYGDSYENFGRTAKQACHTCGGGVVL